MKIKSLFSFLLLYQFLIFGFPASLKAVNDEVYFYCVQSSKEMLEVTNLNGLQLELEPLINWDEIVSYNSLNYHIKIKKSATKRILASEGKTFVVIVNGERIYSGKIWSAMSSVELLCPNILIQDVLKGDEFLIRYGYPKHLSLGDSGKDVRNRPELLNCLRRGDKLKSKK